MKSFRNFGQALNEAIAQGAEKISCIGCNSFSVERSSQKQPNDVANTVLFFSTHGDWVLGYWILGDGGTIELQPEPNLAVARAIAQFYLEDNSEYLNEMMLPRSFQTEDGWQFHLVPEKTRYEANDGSNFELNDFMRYLALSPEEQVDHIFPAIKIRSWTTDNLINWDESLYSPNEFDLYLSLQSEDKKTYYKALITFEGDVQIESGIGSTTWSSGDRLTIEEVNEFPLIYAESLAYGAAYELGIKVTHRESAPDSGEFVPVW